MLALSTLNGRDNKTKELLHVIKDKVIIILQPSELSKEANSVSSKEAISVSSKEAISVSSKEASSVSKEEVLQNQEASSTREPLSNSQLDAGSKDHHRADINKKSIK